MKTQSHIASVKCGKCLNHGTLNKGLSAMTFCATPSQFEFIFLVAEYNTFFKITTKCIEHTIWYGKVIKQTLPTLIKT